MDLNTLWFVLLGVLLAGYAILDGFDLGVGIIHLAARNERERRLMINSIGPLWDGNEVWLVTFGSDVCRISECLCHCFLRLLRCVHAAAFCPYLPGGFH